MAKKILFVEDDPVSLVAGTESMKRLGYEVLKATCAKEATVIIRETVPDIIVLDVMLPDCDGFTFGQKLQSHPRTKDIPIAFVTSKDSPADIQRGFKSGGKIYLTKPFTEIALQTALKTLSL